MDLTHLTKKPLPQMPPEIAKAISLGRITATPFEAKNDILRKKSVQDEVGFKRLDDGSYLVSMTCPMPGITVEMIEWWFWWHPQADQRYRVWFPGQHYGISFSRKDRDYFAQSSYPGFQKNTQYPTERIGKFKMPLRIDFVSPEEFGFSQDIMRENNIPLIVCGHVGALKGMIWHTEMAHIFRESSQGLLLVSRFWIGQSLKNPLLRKLILNDETARDMAEHCCIEYRNLCEILSELYPKKGTAP